MTIPCGISDQPGDSRSSRRPCPGVRCRIAFLPVEDAEHYLLAVVHRYRTRRRARARDLIVMRPSFWMRFSAIFEVAEDLKRPDDRVVNRRSDGGTLVHARVRLRCSAPQTRPSERLDVDSVARSFDPSVQDLVDET